MADVTLTAVLEAQIKEFEKDLRLAMKAVEELSKKVDKEGKKIPEVLGKIAPSSNTAAFALTNLGRVAQDAPFGFIGIQNNLNPLLESFQKLRQESGSNASALKLLGQSLIGPAGLGLALSLVTSAITLFIQYQQRNAAALKNSKKAGDDYVSTLDAARQAELKGAQQGAQEVTRLNILYNAVTNTTLSLKSRNQAYDELAGKYPQFFTNADRENTLLGRNYTAYNNLTQAIINAAKAKAYESKIGELSNKEFENGEKLVALIRARTKNTQELNEAQKRLAANNNVRVTGSGTTGIGGFQDTALPAKLNSLRQKAADIEQSINDKLNENAGIRKTVDDLASRATTAEAAAGFKTGQQLDDRIKKTKALAREVQVLNLAQQAGPDGGVSPNTGPFLGDASTIAGMQNAIKVLGAYVDAQLKAHGATNIFNKELLREKTNLELVENVLGGGLTQAFESTLQGTQSFVSAMGQFLGQLIKKLIAAALAAAALTALLKFTGIGTLLGISSSASSFGNVFKGLSGLNFLADGGITNGPTLAMIGEGREKEIVAPLSKFDQMVQSRADSGNMEVTTKVSGSDLLLVVSRAQKSQGRKS